MANESIPRVERLCINCKTPLTDPRRTKYCSTRCLRIVGNITKKEGRKTDKTVRFCILCSKRIKNYDTIYCSHKCSTDHHTGFNHPNYKGGSIIRGYRKIWINGEQIPEHRHIMQEHLGRKLLSSEIVHHKDKNKLNNELSNLELMSRSEHAKHHRLETGCLVPS